MKIETKQWLPVAILAAAGVVVALLAITRPVVVPESPEVLAPLVRAIAARPQDFQFVVTAHGTVAPRTESELVPQVSGEVVWVSPVFVSGGFFDAGDPLVRIDPSDYEAAAESARAANARARSQEQHARKARERQQQLADRSAASQSRIDDVENDYRVAAANLRESQALLSRAERDLTRTELMAPYAGRVRQERVDPGQFVARGEAIATLYAVDYAEVRLPIADRELAYLDLPLSAGSQLGTDGGGSGGPQVRLQAEFAGSRRTWNGEIVRTEGEIDPKSRMVHAVARVEDPYGLHAAGETTPLAVGLFVEAEIMGRVQPGVVVLPRTALRADDKVLVVEGGDHLRFRSVVVLRTEGETVVIGSGLAVGERVCVSPLPGAIDGMPARVLDVDSDDEPDLAGLQP